MDRRKDGNTGKVIFAFLGIFAVMFSYNLFIFIVTRQKSYAYYLVVCFLHFTVLPSILDIFFPYGFHRYLSNLGFPNQTCLILLYLLLLTYYLLKIC